MHCCRLNPIQSWGFSWKPILELVGKSLSVIVKAQIMATVIPSGNLWISSVFRKEIYFWLFCFSVFISLFFYLSLFLSMRAFNVRICFMMLLFYDWSFIADFVLKNDRYLRLNRVGSNLTLFVLPYNYPVSQLFLFWFSFTWAWCVILSVAYVLSTLFCRKTFLTSYLMQYLFGCLGSRYCGIF